MGNPIQTMDEIRDLSSKVESKACELVNKLVRIQDWIKYTKKETFDLGNKKPLTENEKSRIAIQAIDKIANN